MTARLKVGQKAPHGPKLDRHSTGKGIRYIAPARPFSAIKNPARIWPPKEQAMASHMVRPMVIPVEAEYKLLTFAVAENQNIMYVN
jgi:hypothetical protein